MTTKERLARALAKRDVMEMPWETLTPAAQWVYLCDIDAVLAEQMNIEETEENAALLPAFRTMVDLILEGK